MVVATEPSKATAGLLGPDHHLLWLDGPLLIIVGYSILGLYLQCSPFATLFTLFPLP